MDRIYNTDGEKINAYNILVEKREGNIKIERPRCRWKGRVGVWVGFERFKIGYCEHGNEPSGSRKDKESLDQLSDHAKRS
jgi:hypothetical protein